MNCHIRIAKPVRDLMLTEKMYTQGLKLTLLGKFENHEGFDGIMLGTSGMNYDFEFTHCKTHEIIPTSTCEDLVVLYEPNYEKWQKMCDDMINAGFVQVTSFNPYWDVNGKTFQDIDGYRVVIQNAEWSV